MTPIERLKGYRLRLLKKGDTFRASVVQQCIALLMRDNEPAQIRRKQGTAKVNYGGTDSLRP
jgi:hypothetical protein